MVSAPQEKPSCSEGTVAVSLRMSHAMAFDQQRGRNLDPAPSEGALRMFTAMNSQTYTGCPSSLALQSLHNTLPQTGCVLKFLTSMDNRNEECRNLCPSELTACKSHMEPTKRQRGFAVEHGTSRLLQLRWERYSRPNVLKKRFSIVIMAKDESETPQWHCGTISFTIPA